METFVIATHNAHKIAELSRILEPMGIHVVAAEVPDVEETGTTFEENARLKAVSACQTTGLPSVADDSGIEVDALNGAPGIYSARYAGENATDADRNKKLLEELKDVPMEKRTARFVSAISCVFPQGEEICVTGICEGKVAFQPKGQDGFGYDPIFLVGEKTYAELSPQEKDAVSHRGKALRMLQQELKKRRENQDADE